MTFYFKPPRGTITLQTLRSCIRERLKYLKHIESLDDLSNFEEPLDFQYLLDGSALDRTGHYMLRLLSIKVDNVFYFFKKYETILFEKRLKSLEPHQVRLELKTAQRHLNEIYESSNVMPKYELFSRAFMLLCQKLSQRDWANHAFSPGHSPDCEQFSLEVPFSVCLPLVQQRLVDLNKGIATVPCGKWQPFLVCLFEIHLEFGLDQLKGSSTLEEALLDNRVECITETYKNFFRSSTLGNNGSHMLKCKSIDGESKTFPPCMASLHKILRRRHRLSHDARFHYSLFLKDIGLLLDEACEFWRMEYAQPHEGCTSCSHSWQKDGKRYLYSIRHLYGLEGSRKTYKTPCCRKLMSLTLGSNAEGGCPFVHYDDEKLISSFNDKIHQSPNTVQSILLTNKTKGPQAACQKYLFFLNAACHEKNNETEYKSVIFENPVKFYMGLKNVHKASQPEQTK